MRCYGYALLKVSEDAPRSAKARIYKIMSGTTVSIRGRRYRARGLAEDVGGVRLADALYAIPYESMSKVLEKLSEKGLEGYVQTISLCTCTCEQ